MAPLSGTPTVDAPVGQRSRGSIGSPTLSSACDAVADACWSSDDGYHAPAHRSQRPHGAAVSSSSWRCRNSIRQPRVVS
ncbi:hypothetical protein CMMCAS05_06400 [Clavibacter michiganensis subsp. michiganensis]|nr:hypothetical protein CMMCAS05_06400 [Clavibacter michiganensis subsp. michiganensis]